jgi:hypothetical protein
MLEPPACAKNARRLGGLVEAAANVVVAPADDPDIPTRWLVQGCAAIHSNVS